MTIKNPLNDLMGYQLRRASIAMELDIRKRLKSFGLTPTLSTILILIDSNDQMTQSILSKVLSIKRANMVACINTLEKNDYVRREAIDGRSQMLILTDEGKSLLVEVLEQIHKNENIFKNKVGTESVEELTEKLSKIWE